MEMVQAGISIPLEVSFDSPLLYVGLVVYEVTTGTPVKVAGPTAMPLVYDTTYFGVFTPNLNKSYVAVKAVYTDDTLTTLDSNYRPGSESFVAAELGGSGGGGSSLGEIIGIILPSPTLVGIIGCS